MFRGNKQRNQFQQEIVSWAFRLTEAQTKILQTPEISSKQPSRWKTGTFN